jgi:hypothetical protein
MNYWEEFINIIGFQKIEENDPIVFLINNEEFQEYKAWSLKLLAKLKPTMHRMNMLEPIELLRRLYSNILPIVWRSLEHLKTH